MRQAECRDFSGAESSASALREELEIGTPEILKTESGTMPVIVDTTMGQLILDYQSIHFALDTGREVTFEEIDQVCSDFWKEWSAKAKEAQKDA